MSLYNMLLKIVQKCKIKTSREGEWFIRTYPDGSWRAIRTAYDDVAPGRWQTWGSLYYAPLYNWGFPSTCQNPKIVRVQSNDKDGATWLNLKRWNSTGLNGLYAISPTTKNDVLRINVIIEIEGGY